MAHRTMYTLDIHLKSGTVMTVTVLDLKVSSSKVEWLSYGPDPLLWVDHSQIAGVVERDEREVDVPEDAKMFVKDVE